VSVVRFLWAKIWGRMRTANKGRFWGLPEGLVRLWCALCVGSRCGVALWLNISACVGFPWRGACSCVGACGFAPCGAFKWLGAFARGVRVGLGVDGVRGGGGVYPPVFFTRLLFCLVTPIYPDNEKF
jgi:hypothetical protein